MGLAPPERLMFHQAFWPAGAANWMLDEGNSLTSGFGTDVTFIDAIHPLDNSQEEQVLRFDGNGAAHRVLFQLSSAAGTGGVASWSMPGSPAVRYALNQRIIAAFDSGASAPSAQAFWFGNSGAGGANTWAVYINTDWTVTLKVWDNGASEETFTSTEEIQLDDAFRQYEIWGVLCESDGTPLSSARWVFRTIENLTTTRDEVVFINDEGTDDIPSRSINIATLQVGESASRGAGFGWDACAFYGAIEDADDPWGVIRNDMMYPDGNGTFQEFSGGIAFGDVDEMGDGTLANRVPDDGGTFDVHVYSHGVDTLPKYQTYTQSAPAYVTSDDSLIGMGAGIRGNTSAVGKGFSASPTHEISDGSSLFTLGGITVGTTYNHDAYIMGLNPLTTAAWDFADLAGLEHGGGVESADLSHTYRITALQLTICYQADGETTPAVPDQVVAGGQKIMVVS
jgi:hypothetical protein